MDWTTTQRNMQRSQLQIFGNTNKTMCWTLVSIPQVEWHALSLSEQGRSFWHLPLSAQTNRQTVSVFFSSPYITIVLVVSSVTNWLPHASTAAGAVAVALVMSSFHGKLHSTVLLKKKKTPPQNKHISTQFRHMNNWNKVHTTSGISSTHKSFPQNAAWSNWSFHACLILAVQVPWH